MADFTGELLDETMGGSSKRWALLLFALGIGAAAALWISGRLRTQAPVDVPPDAPPAPAPESAQTTKERAASTVGSAWTMVSRRPAVLQNLPTRPALRRRERPADADADADAVSDAPTDE